VLAVSNPIPYDWFFLIIRLAFVGLLYLFIWQVMRITMRDLRRSTAVTTKKRSAKAKMVIIDPAESIVNTGTSYSIGPKTSIGRHPDCSIVIDEPFLSSLHATIESRNKAWYVTDHESTNGTFVNGRMIKGTAYIEADDVVQFGRIKLQFFV